MDTESKIKNFSLILVAIFIIANLLLLDFFLVSQKNDLEDLKTRFTQFKIPVIAEAPAPVKDNSCPQTCVSLISSATRSATVRQTVNPPIIQQPPVITTTTQKGEYFINLGEGSVNNSDYNSSNWKTLDSAQATLDASNYGNIKSITLEVFAHVLSSGDVYVRLFDSTTPAIIWGSELSANSTSSVYKSVSVTLAPGNKTYKIQIYSTLSTGYLDQARIHIVTQ